MASKFVLVIAKHSGTNSSIFQRFHTVTCQVCKLIHQEQIDMVAIYGKLHVGTTLLIVHIYISRIISEKEKNCISGLFHDTGTQLCVT